MCGSAYAHFRQETAIAQKTEEVRNDDTLYRDCLGRFAELVWDVYSANGR
jgi:hypothetical protein